MYNFFQYYNKYIDFSALGCAKDARASKSDRQKNDKFVVTTMQVAKYVGTIPILRQQRVWVGGIRKNENFC